MVAGTSVAVWPSGNRLSYAEASDLASRVMTNRRWGTVLVNLEHVSDATTAGLARLAVLRRDLLKGGHDLRVAGLCGRTRCLYDLCRIRDILPEQETRAD